MSINQVLSSYINNVLPKNSQGTNNYTYPGNGEGSDFNTATGDSIGYSPSVHTAYSGDRAVTTASIGPETLAKFSGGAASVYNHNNGNEVADENGQLYTVNMNSPHAKRVDLGSDSNEHAQAAARGILGGGSSGQSMLNDLEATSAGGLGDAATVQQHEDEFGVDSQSGLTDLTAMLAEAGKAQQSVSSGQNVSSNTLLDLGAVGQLASSAENSTNS